MIFRPKGTTWPTTSAANPKFSRAETAPLTLAEATYDPRVAWALGLESHTEPKGATMKKNISVLGVVAVAALALAGCSSDGKTDTGSESAGAEASSDKAYVIGISVQDQHPSLDAAVDGFKAAVEESGLDVTFDEKNAFGDAQMLASIAGTFKEDGTDLVLAVGTQAAQACASAMTDTPILFTAVTEPADAQLVESWENPGGNVTGTSDKNPVDEQIELIGEIVPDVKTVGVVYSPGEANSVVQVEWVKDAADKMGIEIVESPATAATEVQQAAQSLASSGVDAIYVPTDNTVVASLETVLQVGEDNKIPVFGAEGDSVARGAVATYGLDYYQLGYETGLMAVQILRDGAEPGDLPVATVSDPALYLNLGASERMGIAIPAELVEQADPENVTN